MTTQQMLSAIRSRYAELAALFLNLLGTILLSVSFQASTSEFRLVKTVRPPDGMRITNPEKFIYSICVKNEAVAEKILHGSLEIGSNEGCVREPDSDHVAVVTSNHPKAGFWGIIANAAGFALQFIIILLKKSPNNTTILE